MVKVFDRHFALIFKYYNAHSHYAMQYKKKYFQCGSKQNRLYEMNIHIARCSLFHKNKNT